MRHAPSQAMVDAFSRPPTLTATAAAATLGGRATVGGRGNRRQAAADRFPMGFDADSEIPD